ncbi:hypothetical protein HZH66_006334 [Vespula vulgaris]|uniref:Uncharacterized protein n=1 Tax=Vespula vulgaris TaxID=7454 RepID=A0A834K1P3_VESVU|nr:hypothetical protein HZH66_006334 [Vespula vulgaris]
MVGQHVLVKDLHRAAVYNGPLTLWCYAADGRVARCPVTPMSACYPDRPIVICNYPKTAPNLSSPFRFSSSSFSFSLSNRNVNEAINL